MLDNNLPMIKSGQKIFGLSWTLAKANFKLRTEGSYLGILWYLLDPLAFFMIFFYIFRNNLGQQLEFYPLYLIFGLVMFNFFSSTTNQAVNAISANALFVKSMKVNSFALILSVVLQTVFSHIFELVILFFFLLYFGLNPFWLILYLPIFFFFLLFVLGVSLFLATVGVYVLDLSNVWRVVSQILFFSTPIFYVAPDNPLLLLNPVIPYLKLSREVIIYHQVPNSQNIILAVTFSVISLAVGSLVLKKFKNKFAENL